MIMRKRIMEELDMMIDYSSNSKSSVNMVGF